MVNSRLPDIESSAHPSFPPPLLPIIPRQDSAVNSYSVGAAIGGSRWSTSLTCTNKMQTYNASGYYIFQPNLVGSVLAACTPETSENS